MSAQVIDYSTLTDRELDVEIAKRLGLTFRNWDGLEICEVHSGVAYWVFKSYATDANAALTLWQDAPEQDFALYKIDGKWGVEVSTGDTMMDAVFGEHESAARALCECWLKYQDAKNVSDTH